MTTERGDMGKRNKKRERRQAAARETDAVLDVLDWSARRLRELAGARRGDDALLVRLCAGTVECVRHELGREEAQKVGSMHQDRQLEPTREPHERTHDMSTETTPNGETMQRIAQLMEGLPGSLSDQLCEIVKAATGYVNDKRAESRRTFTVEEAWHLTSLDFDLEDRETWPPAMRKWCDESAELDRFELADADADMRHEVLDPLVFATISPVFAYVHGLIDAIHEYYKDAALVDKLALRLDCHADTLVYATIEACRDLTPKIAASIPQQTPRELMRGILAEAQAEREAAKAADAA
jgi:hypothetical protein